MHEDTRFDEGTPQDVRNAILWALRNRTRVRLFYGDTKTGAAWPEEHDVFGRIGRSLGAGPNSQRVPLLIANARKRGGVAILTASIVGICYRAGGRRLWAYKHPTFTVGTFTMRPAESEWNGHKYRAEVDHNGALIARFPTEAKALRYIAFIMGDRMANAILGGTWKF